MNNGILGVLFDFAGTLFGSDEEPAAALLAIGVPAARHPALIARLERVPELAAELEIAAEQSGLAERWARRDLCAADHRSAFIGLYARAGLPADIAGRWYDRAISAGAWHPYGDTADVLHALRNRGIPVAIVSNIGWDPRPVFTQHGIHDLVDAYVLSYETGVMKPDPRIFALACEAIGVPPQSAVMLGDSETSDGAAAALGCRFVHVRQDGSGRPLMNGLGLEPETVPPGPPSPVPPAEGGLISEPELALADIWSAVLRRPVSVDDDFFELGGNSLLAARLAALIRKRLGTKVNLSVILRRPTPAAMAELLTGQRADDAAGSERALDAH